MSRHESLTCTGYCEACYGPLVVRRDNTWLMTFVECQNLRCWRGVVTQISDVDVAQMDPAERAELAAYLATIQGGGA